MLLRLRSLFLSLLNASTGVWEDAKNVIILGDRVFKIEVELEHASGRRVGK
jgi:hypothetical protein